jgi:ABC-type Mn2+/Zn2+ transport system ATPase subunit
MWCIAEQTEMQELTGGRVQRAVLAVSLEETGSPTK